MRITDLLDIRSISMDAAQRVKMKHLIRQYR